MSQTKNNMSKQALAWTAVFALLLSILPYSAADQTSNEYFESWSYELEDTDGDNQNDIIFFTFDVDTNVTDYVDIVVTMNVNDDNGNFVGYEEEDYEIYWTDNDTFEMEWFVDDCDNECEAPYDFNFRLYEDIDGQWYYEDSFNETNIWLNETTIVPEGIVQVDNGVLADDEDGLHNDILFRAIMEDYGIENVTIELEKKVGTQWVDLGDEVTNDDGEAAFHNRSSGEYRWFASHGGEEIDKGHTFVFYSPNSDENIGHIGVMDDFDGDDDFDEFVFARIIGNGSDDELDSNDGVYVELFHAENNTFYDEDGGDGEGWALVFHDVEEGNYTFNMYNGSSSGDLMQTGWMHSYGSLNTHHDIWFEEWNYTTDDENNNGIDDIITVGYNPDTSCNCTVEINVWMQVYNDTGSFVYGQDYYHEINGTEEDWFETEDWSPEKDGNYTFEFFLVHDESEGSPEDSFNFTVYLECNSEYSYDCDYEEWFEEWDYETYDDDDNGEDDTIIIGYDPDTDCGCEMNVSVQMYVYDDNNNYVYYDEFSHEIDGEDDDWFETDPWSPYENGNYTFELRLYDNHWNWEDEFNFTTYLECNAESNSSYCTYEIWFEDWDYKTYDENDNGENDTIIVGYNPDTECNCSTNVSVYMNVFDENSNYVFSDYFYHEINGTEEDWFETDDWSPNEDGNYTFEFRLFGTNTSGWDSFNFTIYLECFDDCGSVEDEWFENIWYNVNDEDDDGWNDTFEIEFNPDTTCDCTINVTSVLSIVDSSNNTQVDKISYTDDIYSDEQDYFFMDWTPEYNGTFDFYLDLYDEEDHHEDSKQFFEIELHVRSEEGHDESEWFEDENFESDQNWFQANYLPMTDCDCWVKIWVYIDVYYDGDKVDTISEEMYIHRDDEEWYSQDWYASETGYYDFYVVMFNDEGNGPHEVKDEYWVYEVYLQTDESYDEYFEDYQIYISDSDDDGHNDTFFGEFWIATECDCEVDMLVFLDIFDVNEEMVDTMEESITVSEDNMQLVTFYWENHHAEGEYRFDIILEDATDDDNAMREDEWGGSYYLYEASDDNGDSELSIDGLDYETNLFEGQNMEFEVILSNLGDEGCVVDWDMGDGTRYQNSYDVRHIYKDNGLYQVVIYAYNDDTSVNASFEIYVKNIPPTILNVMFDEVINEGDISSFNIQYDDVPTDEVTVTWSFPDEILEGDFVQYKFANDGEFVIMVTVEDDDGGATMEQKMIKVQNVAPIFTEFDVPTEGGDPGVALDFVVLATDPGENDVITYTFNFGDGTAILLSKTGNATHKFTEGASFDVEICAIDEDGGEACKIIPIPIALLEQLEDSGLSGFGFLGVVSALGAITLLRRRTH